MGKLNKKQLIDYHEQFIKIDQIKSDNIKATKSGVLNNLIQGPKIGFNAFPPFDSISIKSWQTQTTKSRRTNFFDQNPEPIILDLHLDSIIEFDAIGIWHNRISVGDSIRDFTIQFSNDKNALVFSTPILKKSIETNPFNLEIFSFKAVKARLVRITVFSNRGREINLKGNRLGCNEITLIKNHKTISHAMNSPASGNYCFDLMRPLVGDKLTNFEYNVLNIRSEFALDEFWKAGSSYNDFLRMRGFYVGGGQLRRIDLSKWADKIYVYHFLQEHGIKGMPICHYTQRLNDDFIIKIKELYYAGMDSFVIKMNQLAFGTAVIRVKNGHFIHSHEHDSKHKDYYGKRVDFGFINSQIKKYWFDQQFTEEWASLMVSPGVILEELIDQPMELKFTVVFGSVIGFFIEHPDLPTFNADGESLKDLKHEPPFWWQQACKKARQVATLVRADHIRIDLFYHNGEVIVCEITWCGIEMLEHKADIAKKLNQGYAIRQRELTQNNTPPDV